MKVRISPFHFWTCFIMLALLHLFLLMVPIVDFIRFLVNQEANSNMKLNIIVGTIYLAVVIVSSIIFYVVWRIKIHFISF